MDYPIVYHELLGKYCFVYDVTNPRQQEWVRHNYNSQIMPALWDPWHFKVRPLIPLSRDYDEACELYAWIMELPNADTAANPTVTLEKQKRSVLDKGLFWLQAGIMVACAVKLISVFRPLAKVFTENPATNV